MVCNLHYILLKNKCAWQKIWEFRKCYGPHSCVCTRFYCWHIHSWKPKIVHVRSTILDSCLYTLYPSTLAGSHVTVGNGTFLKSYKGNSHSYVILVYLVPVHHRNDTPVISAARICIKINVICSMVFSELGRKIEQRIENFAHTLLYNFTLQLSRSWRVYMLFFFPAYRCALLAYAMHKTWQD